MTTSLPFDNPHAHRPLHEWFPIFRDGSTPPFFEVLENLARKKFMFDFDKHIETQDRLTNLPEEIQEENEHQYNALNSNQVLQLLRVMDDITKKGFLDVLDKMHVKNPSFYDAGYKSLLFKINDELLLRIALPHDPYDIQKMDRVYDIPEILQPLDQTQFGKLSLEIVPLLKDRVTDEHIKQVRGALARKGLLLWDEQPRNFRLLPNRERTPILVDKGTVMRPWETSGYMSKLQRHQEEAEHQEIRYKWVDEEGVSIQQALFKDPLKNLALQQRSQTSFTPVPPPAGDDPVARRLAFENYMQLVKTAYHMAPSAAQSV